MGKYIQRAEPARTCPDSDFNLCPHMLHCCLSSWSLRISAFPSWVVSKVVVPLGGFKIAFQFRIETLVWISLVLVYQDRVSQAVVELTL